MAKVIEGLKVVAEAVREIAIQRTEQERLRSAAQVEIARIHAMRDLMLDYLDRCFDERRNNFETLFAQLDKATTSANLEVVVHTLEAIVTLANASPFKDLADAAKAQRVLRDKSTEWEF